MTKDHISYLPVDNGDSIIIKAGQNTVLTDINYRKDDDTFDIKPAIEESCTNSVLNYFILTHTDQDHVRGFNEVFHCGEPSKWDEDKNIRVDTIVCSQYVIDLTNPTDIAKPLVQEIRRRNNLKCDVDGNRLIIVEDGSTLNINNSLKGYVLSPSETELKSADPKADKDEETNNTSVVIRWVYQIFGGNETNILLGGDSEYEVWQRLDEKDSTELNWHLITAPHHCSLTPLAYKAEGEDDYTDDDKAINALSHKLGKGFVVSSSKPIQRNSDNPPHYKGKQKWLKILRNNNHDTPENRFFCTATYGNNDKAGIVKFELNEKGIKLFSDNNASKTAVVSSLNRPTRYGHR